MPGPCSTPKVTTNDGVVVEGKTATRKLRRPDEPEKVKPKRPVRYRYFDDDEDYE